MCLCHPIIDNSGPADPSNVHLARLVTKCYVEKRKKTCLSKNGSHQALGEYYRRVPTAPSDLHFHEYQRAGDFVFASSHNCHRFRGCERDTQFGCQISGHDIVLGAGINKSEQFQRFVRPEDRDRDEWKKSRFGPACLLPIGKYHWPDEPRGWPKPTKNPVLSGTIISK